MRDQTIVMMVLACMGASVSMDGTGTFAIVSGQASQEPTVVIVSNLK